MRSKTEGVESAVGEFLKSFCKNEDGATAIEYAIMAAMIAIPLITVLGNVGTAVQKPFADVKAGFQNAP